MRYIISGVAFSGNKGASGMAEALIQNLSRLDPAAFFSVFSYYPAADRLQLRYANAEIIDGSPKRVVLLFFASLWAAAGRLFGLPKARRAAGREMKAIAAADVWLDASGISFVDGREKFLIFNVLSILPALALGVPVVKVAQAMGPFRNPVNRLAARIVLPRLARIIARGATTAGYLAELKLTNVGRYSDVAFSLTPGPEDAARIAGYLPPPGGVVIGFSPSQVVWKLCEKRGVDYLGILRRCVERQVEQGHVCLVFPHSARAGSEKTHNNDLPLLRRFAAMLPASPLVRVISDELDAGALRRLIGELDLLVASRFHAIVSAMATGVPAVVIGWSHKYAEVLEPFKLDEFVVGYDELSEAAVEQRIAMIAAAGDGLRSRIRDTAAMIVRENEAFFTEVAELARAGATRS